MPSGALAGDSFCQIYLKIEMGDCDGCPDYQRRIEIYSNNSDGCPAGEFVVEAVEPEVDPDTETDPEVENNDPEDTNTTPTPAPEVDSSIYMKASSALASTMAVLMIEY